MKYLAYIKENGQYRRITIQDVIKGRESNDTNERRKLEKGNLYYSLWEYRKMKAVVNGNRTPHFAYVDPLGEGNGGGGGESPQHELSKHIIAGFKVLKLNLFKVDYEIPIKSATLENPLHYEGRNYRVDVMLDIEPCLFSEFVGTTRLAIEIIYSNEVEEEKRKSIENLEEGIALMALTLTRKITANSLWEMEILPKRLLGYWSATRGAYSLGFPLKKQRFMEQQQAEEDQKRLALEKLQAEQRKLREQNIAEELRRKAERQKAESQIPVLDHTLQKKKSFSEENKLIIWFVILALVVIIVALIVAL